MNYFDIIIGVLLLISVVVGWRQGLVRQVFGILALALGVFCAYKFSGSTAAYLSEWFALNEAVTRAAAFAVTFIAVLFLVLLTGRVADRFIKMVALGLVNHLLGTILCVLKMALIISVCIVILKSFELLPEKAIHDSFLYQPLEDAGSTVFPYLQKVVSYEWKVES
ncbi:MAG: CvpA family protein [Prevotellaceae bacterium]|jgi:membrane protein required for colicin V production|nr:CvpA family protein [Prevotellaceae bacterium]